MARRRRTTTPARPALDDEVRAVLDALRRIVRALRVSAGGAERRLGISAAQLFLLQQAAAGNGSSVNELAARAHTDQSTVSTVVSRLAAAGLVRRRDAADDARRTEVVVTARGRALLRRAPAAPQERFIAALGRLPAAERRGLARHLAAFVRALRLEGEPAALFFEDAPERARGRRRAPAA